MNNINETCSCLGEEFPGREKAQRQGVLEEEQVHSQMAGLLELG